MGYKFYFDENVKLPDISCDDDLESIVGAFVSSDIGRSEKTMNIIFDKLRKSKKSKKRDSYPGEICTFFVKGEEVTIEDNCMMFDEPTSFHMSVPEFEKLLLDWKTFVKKCGCLK